MIPLQQLSSQPVPAPYLHGDAQAYSPLDDYEPGGEALNDPTEGLWAWLWRLRCVDGHALLISRQGQSEATLFTRAGTVTELSLAFDQNMRPTVAFVEDGQAWLYWYDPTLESATFTELAGDVDYPRVTMDDKRERQLANNDIILAYLRAGDLYYRMQRERYQTERLLAEDVAGPLRKVAMNTGMRLQFEFGPLELP